MSSVDQWRATKAAPQAGFVWQPLERSRSSSLVDQLVNQVITGVCDQRLRVDQRLPPTRVLAQELGVHRNTVVAAYKDLALQGWVDNRRGSGTFVSRVHTRGPGPAKEDGPAKPRYRLRQAVQLLEQVDGKIAYHLAGGRPDLRLLAVEEWSRAVRRVLKRDRERLLNYGSPLGLRSLRSELAKLLTAERGLYLTADNLLVTRGAQMALYLVAAAVIEPGDRVAVEAYGYPPAWEAFRRAGAVLVPIDVDADGLCVDQLEAAGKQAPIKAVYLTPHHQFPTMATLSADRRMRLLQLADELDWVIVEDDYDHEFHFAGRPVAPLAHHDVRGRVIHVGTMSKVMCPGIRIGYVVGHPMLTQRLAELRVAIDRQGDRLSEAALVQWLRDGTFLRHRRRMHKVYQARQQVMAGLLEQLDVDFMMPAGGLAFWVKLRGDDAGQRLVTAQRSCWSQGIHVERGQRYRFDGQPDAHFRCGFSSLDEAEIVTVMTAVGRVLG